MALNIRHAETERLAAELAQATGETKTEAVRRAVQERLVRIRGARSRKLLLAERLSEIATHCAALPIRDSRPFWEILGF